MPLIVALAFGEEVSLGESSCSGAAAGGGGELKWFVLMPLQGGTTIKADIITRKTLIQVEGQRTV